MASEAQIAANQRNALKSTGPKTEEGKAATGKNALRHGLCSARTVIFEETAGDFEEFAAGLRAALDPGDDYEVALAERIVHLEWRLRRVWRMEAAALDDAVLAAYRRRERDKAAALLTADFIASRPTGEETRPSDLIKQSMHKSVCEWDDVELLSFNAANGAGQASTLPALWPQHLAALGRYEAALERQLHRATRTLEHRQALRRVAEQPAKTLRPAARPVPPRPLPAPPPVLPAPANVKITEQSQFAGKLPPPNAASFDYASLGTG